MTQSASWDSDAQEVEEFAETPADGPTVLVVDDDAPIREMLAFALEMEGYRVLVANDGREALTLLDAERVDLVTLDVMMPGMSGWDVADTMRANPRTRNLPRIMISGMAVDQLMRACATRQAAAIISKPFDLDKVIELIGTLVPPPGFGDTGESLAG